MTRCLVTSRQHGLTNTLTFNSGSRIADGYQALMLGGVYGSSLGAFGANLTWSHARVPESEAQSGWMSQLTRVKLSSLLQPPSPRQVIDTLPAAIVIWLMCWESVMLPVINSHGTPASGVNSRASILR